jgi:hypothetical protein
MPKFAVMAIAAAFVGVALVGPAQATNKPADSSLIIVQTQVPPECAEISNPEERAKCLQEKQGK